jgi:hypothetical protein
MRVCSYAAGFGIDIPGPGKKAAATSIDKFYQVDSIVNDAIAQKAFLAV